MCVCVCVFLSLHMAILGHDGYSLSGSRKSSMWSLCRETNGQKTRVKPHPHLDFLTCTYSLSLHYDVPPCQAHTHTHTQRKVEHATLLTASQTHFFNYPFYIHHARELTMLTPCFKTTLLRFFCLLFSLKADRGRCATTTKRIDTHTQNPEWQSLQ